jgi:hypothetical protein
MARDPTSEEHPGLDRDQPRLRDSCQQEGGGADESRPDDYQERDGEPAQSTPPEQSRLPGRKHVYADRQGTGHSTMQRLGAALPGTIGWRRRVINLLVCRGVQRGGFENVSSRSTQ